MRRIVGILLALAASLSGTAARACSVVESYARPSNFELVQIADAIVVARAERAVGASSAEGSVVFQVESSAKGQTPSRITLPWASLGKPVPSDLTDLSGSNPEGHMGPCNRTTFASGARYLLFLNRADDGDWRQLGYPFSRINEDYAGEDNAWMRVVRRYLRLQQSTSPMDQMGTLARMVESGRDENGGQLSVSERDDIADHLRSISQWKPTRHLLDLYGRLESGEAVTPRTVAANGEAGNLDEVAGLLLGMAPSEPQQEPQRARRMILNALVEGDHPDALPLFEALSARTDLDADQRGLTLRFFARSGQYPRAYTWIETKLLPELGRLSSDDALRLLDHVGAVQTGESYEDGKERWRSDPHAAATWPELAFALYRFAAPVLGKDRIGGWITNPLSEIRVSNYRERPELTIALAEDYDEQVSQWAFQELARAQQPSDPNLDTINPVKHPDMLPLQVLASAWSSERYEALERAFCDGGRRRQLTLLALGEAGGELYESLLPAMAGTPNLSVEERGWLLRAAIGFQARRFGDASRSSWMGGEPSKWLVTRLAQGQQQPPTSLCKTSAAAPKGTDLAQPCLRLPLDCHRRTNPSAPPFVNGATQNHDRPCMRCGSSRRTCRETRRG